MNIILYFKKHWNLPAVALALLAAALLLHPTAAHADGEPALSLDRQALDLCPGDAAVTLTPIFTPEDIAAPVVWASSDESIATVDGAGAVTAVALGAAEITASTGDGSLSAVCAVAVKAGELSTSVYALDRPAGLLAGLQKFTPPSLFFENFDNDAANLGILDKDGNPYGGKFVGTGATVQLIINGTPRDSFKVVVLGDASGDGAVSISDYSLARLDILGRKKLSGEYFLAGDVNADGVISISDYSLMRLDILGRRPIGGSAGFDLSGITDFRIKKFLEFSLTLLGKPYVLGEEGPDKFDCSGLVYYCLNETGYRVGRSTAETYSKKEAWQYVPKDGALQPGDLLFFTSEEKPDKIGHVGIYLGDGKLINASYSCGCVIICPMTGWYVEYLSHARRVFQ